MACSKRFGRCEGILAASFRFGIQADKGSLRNEMLRFDTVAHAPKQPSKVTRPDN